MKILAFSTIRSDFEVMSSLYSAIQREKSMSLGLVVAGPHLSPTYGYTVRDIEQVGIPILARIESLIDSDSKLSRLKSAGVLLQNCLHTIAAFAPDALLLCGDREDAMVAALIGAYGGIPTVHVFGGDHAADGNVDNPVRHAISKLTSLHFVAHERHRERLLRMGESARRIFVIGSPAIDKIIQEPQMEKSVLLRRLGRPAWRDFAIMLHHPILGHENKAGLYCKQILEVLKRRRERAFVIYPNSDAGNRESIRILERFRQEPSFCFFKSLPRSEFINLMRHARFMIGNSSAGLLEAPSIPLGVVNVGARQSGRINPGNAIFCDQKSVDIDRAVARVLSPWFQKRLARVRSPFGDGFAAQKAVSLLKTLDLRDFRFKYEDPLAEPLEQLNKRDRPRRGKYE